MLPAAPDSILFLEELVVPAAFLFMLIFTPRFPAFYNFGGDFVNVVATFSTLIPGLCDKPREESLPERPPLDSASNRFSTSSKAFPLLS